MWIEDYLRPTEYVLTRVAFDYLGGRYVGRGLLRWNHQEGWRLDAPVERLGEPLPGFGGGYVGIIKKSHFRSIRMKAGRTRRSWILAPSVLMLERFDVPGEGRISTGTRRVLFLDRADPAVPDATWNGSTIFRMAGEWLERRSTASGLLYEGEDGQRVVGRVVNGEFLELNFALPKSVWSKTEAWEWAVGARTALAICLGRTVGLLERTIQRNNRRFREVIAQQEVRKLGYLALLNGGPRVNQPTFIALANYLARGGLRAEVCRNIFDQMDAAAAQRNQQARELLVATVLEAALRTLEQHPFRGGDKFNVKHALKRFQQTYLTAEWEKPVQRAYRTHYTLRDRNAHPDWLFEERGALSDENRTQSVEDIGFLSRFYGVMILALCGAEDLDPAELLAEPPFVDGLSIV
jgi:hypothetical protein